MATIIRKVNYINPNDVEEAEKLNIQYKDVLKKPGYFVKWTKFSVSETVFGGSSVIREIEMAIIADAVTGQTYPVKSEDFVVDLDNFCEINKIERWDDEKIKQRNSN